MPYRVVASPDEYRPSLQELDPVMGEIPDPVEARWEGGKQDMALLEKWADRELVLYTDSQDSAEKLMASLGCSLNLSQEDIDSAKKALTKRDTSWRSRVEGIGPTRGSMLLAAACGSSIRLGRFPRAAISIAHGCLFQKVHPQDADVLMRLRTSRGR